MRRGSTDATTTGLLLLTTLACLTLLSPAAHAAPSKFCTNALPSLCISGVLSPDSLSADVTITVPPGLWWVAFAIGTDMRNADLLAFYPASAGSKSIVASDRYSKSQSVPTVDTAQDIQLQPDSTVKQDGSMYIHFKRLLKTGDPNDNEFKLGTQAYGVAWRNGPVPSQTMDVNFDLGTHDGHQSASFALLPSSSDSNNDNDNASTNVDQEAADPYNKVIVAHGAVMFVAWIGLVPVGAWMARYLRERKEFKWHVSTSAKKTGFDVSLFFCLDVRLTLSLRIQWYLLFPALLLTLLGLALSVSYVTLSSRQQFHSSHSIMGIILIPLALLQGALGWYIHVKRVGKGEPRPKRNWVHRLLGPCVWIFAVATVIMGYLRYGQLYSLPDATFAPQLFLGIFWVLAWLVAGESWRLARRVGKAKAAKEVEVVVDSTSTGEVSVGDDMGKQGVEKEGSVGSTAIESEEGTGTRKTSEEQS